MNSLENDNLGANTTPFLENLNVSALGFRVADILLPIPQQAIFTYRLEDTGELQPEVGKRVLVQLGKNKLYAGVILKIYQESSLERYEELKNIKEVLDPEPVVTPQLLGLYQWVAEYYLCGVGEVLRASLPLGLKGESTIFVVPTEIDPLKNSEKLSDKEYIFFQALQAKGNLTLQEVQTVLGIANPQNFIKKQKERGWIELQAVYKPKYKPKMENCLILAPDQQIQENLQKTFEKISKNSTLTSILQLVASAWLQKKVLTEKEVCQKLGITAAKIRPLYEQKILQVEKVPVERLPDLSFHQKHKKDIILTEKQVQALNEIRSALNTSSPKPILLHGVTGSGKTHLYIELIKDCLVQERQALYLLPEIGLTKQIIDKLVTEFGEIVGVYHSKISQAERVETWKKVLSGLYRVIIGVRSSIFLPFSELGLIIVDEEHDGSFKQYDPAPRYHARDTAIYYAHKLGIPIILGSATPSLESFTNAKQGRYHLVSLNQRALEARLPQIEIIDMRAQIRNRLSHGLFSDVLLKAMKETLQKGEQIILFHNRRGYSPYLVCQNCGYTPKCLYCDISLTYHKKDKQLKCHYCGYVDSNTMRCRQCKEYAFKHEGIGTERLEEQIQELFPNYQTVRLDTDTTRTKNATQNLIYRFERQEVQILIGTQMVTKGLDFENVTLVAVIQADRLLNFPDFRALENAYQVLTQFSGRAGRSHKQGRVIIQTMNPDHKIFELLQLPYQDFYEYEILQRKKFLYPPYSRLVRIEMQHKDKIYLEQQAQIFGTELRKEFGTAMLGPVYPMVARIKSIYRMQILLKVGKTLPSTYVRGLLKEKIQAYYNNAPNHTLKFVFDVDPR
ncbi:MAG: primosomal protein N' [Bacteroidia bacterium]|nr:primosomal protein N' [Bacteroidia bacterium]MDW8157900.1 primosomal protein N' [Bacteroidia bacterium]